MIDFSINCHFDKEHMRISKDGVVTGILYVKVCDVNFPDLLWDDFVDRVLYIWINSAIKLLKGSESEVFDFIDGTYEFELKKIKHDCFRITCFEDNKQINISGDISIKDFIDNLSEISHLLLKYMNDNNWNYNYFSEFENNLIHLDDLKEGYR